MTRLILALSLSLGLISAELGGLGQRPTYAENVLEAAVLAGRTAERQPYSLRQSVDGRGTVGAVYTQFIRVARYVWIARQNGTDVEVDDLPDSIRQTSMHVVMQLPTHKEGAAGPMMVALERPPSAAPAGASAYFPLMARGLLPPALTLTVAALEEMVGSVPVPRVGAVGAFPANLADRKVLEFCVYDTDPSGVHHLVSGFVPGPLR